MRETILITGAGPNGITGNRIKSGLKDHYIILSPSSRELDLTDPEAVEAYMENNHVDYVIHSAVVYPSAENDGLAQNLKMFFNLARHSDRYKKMFYLGSGAEYDKSRNIVNVSEEEIGCHIPKDSYGLFKYLMQLHCSRSKNIYNIRLFGTINPMEPYTKNVISNLSMKLVKDLPLELRQNCRFSFTDIDDVIEFIKYGLKHELKWHDYNFVPPQTYLLSDLSQSLCRIAKKDCDVKFASDGLNKEYTGSNSRIKEEFVGFTPIEESLRKVYERMAATADEVWGEEIDRRWNTNKN